MRSLVIRSLISRGAHTIGFGVGLLGAPAQTLGYAARTMFVLLLAIGAVLLPSAALCDIRSNGRATDTLDFAGVTSTTNVVGDTPMFVSWTGSGDSGNFNGGRVFGSANDATNWCPAGGNMHLLELVRLDWSTKSNTSILCVNSMAGYGGSSQINFPAGWADGKTWKTFNILAYNGNLFWWPYRQATGPYYGFQSTVIMSPDKGVHWCNHETYASLVAAGHLGVVGCDSSNWSATGDTPASNTHMAYGVAGSSDNPMARPIHVQFCQNETCSGMPFDADNFHYFATLDGNNYMFATCVAKSAGSIMDPTQNWYWKGGNATCSDTGSWTHTMASAVRVQKQSTDGADNYGYPSSVIYVPASGQFLMTSYDAAAARTMMLASQYPWGPWKRIPMAALDNQGSFVAANLAWLDASCSGCGTDPGRWDMTVVSTQTTYDQAGTFFFRKIPIASGGPSTPYTATAAAAGKGLLGMTRLRVSKDGLNKSLIGNGLILAFGFDDFLDYASSDFQYAGAYTRDLLGSSTCLTGGQNAVGGAVVFGAQNPTAQISYGVGGLHGGSDYMSQFHANAGNCTFTLPASLTGNQAFTIITVLSMDAVTRAQGMIWELQPIGSAAAHNGISFGTNINVEGGSHVDVYDNNVTLKTNPGLTNGQYNMISYVKSAGAFQTTSTVYFGDGSSTKKWCNSGCGSTFAVNGSDSSTLSLSSSAKLILNCATFGSSSQCKNGGSNSSSQGILGATYAFFAVYSRALSAEEINRNYIAIKAALAQSPRSLTVQ